MNFRHGMHDHPLYTTWHRMVSRCHRPNDSLFKYYGARGIEVHPTWRESPVEFISWIENTLGPRPEKHTLDRIDNNKGYEPGNLRWETHNHQMQNQRGKLSPRSSSFKGVWWDKQRGKWQTRVTKNRVTVFRGFYSDELEAAKAYDRASCEAFGSFALTNGVG